MRSPETIHGWRHAVAAGALLIATAGTFATEPPVARPQGEIRAPLGPADIPEVLPGCWRASLCVSENNGHAWIRLEDCETGEVRTIGRYHLLVGGWFDREQFRWNYPPTFRTGLYMDREQQAEFEQTADECILITKVVDAPRLLVNGRTRGHGMVRNNCVTYARDIWYVMTGEKFDLPPIHTPRALRKAVQAAHPEAVDRDPPTDGESFRSAARGRSKTRR
jgi:hypothetical protein